MRGGETLGALTLSRFFAVHVLFLPAVIVTGIALHLFILRRVGPAGPWDERKAASVSETFYPRQVYMDAVVMFCVFVVLAALATLVPFPLADKANPSDTSFVPVPEWYFLFYYELLKYMHGPLEPLVTWVLPGLVHAHRSCSGRFSTGRKQSRSSCFASHRNDARRLVLADRVFVVGRFLEESVCSEAD